MAKVTITLEDMYYDEVTNRDGVRVQIAGLGLDQEEIGAVRVARKIEKLLERMGVKIGGSHVTGN